MTAGTSKGTEKFIRSVNGGVHFKGGKKYIIAPATSLTKMSLPFPQLSKAEIGKNLKYLYIAR